jgi:hypothetical protein
MCTCCLRLARLVYLWCCCMMEACARRVLWW